MCGNRRFRKTIYSIIGLQVHCESSKVNNENIVSVILHDTEKIIVGDNYRFCLVLVQRNNSNSMLIVGCSNETKLKTLESTIDATDGSQEPKHFTDISHLDQMADDESDSQESVESRLVVKEIETSTIVSNPLVKSDSRLTEANVFDNFGEFAVTGLCIGILFTIVFAVFWIAPLVKSDRRSSPATICYAADDHIADIENTNRYLKLQATTTL